MLSHILNRVTGAGLLSSLLIFPLSAFGAPPFFDNMRGPTPISIEAPSKEPHHVDTTPLPKNIPIQPRLQTRGVLQARQTTHLAATLSARILKANYKSGQSFKRGIPLISFDCAQLKAETLALQAARTSARLSHDNIQELFQAGAAGELELTLANAKVKRADAELGVAKVKQKNCTIYAPYDGVVQNAHIAVYDTPALNAPLLTILRAGTPEIKLIAPSAWMRWIKPGLVFNFTIDETGKTHQAAILRSGASVDPVSQTIELTAKFKTGANGALVGMSGVAVFPPLKTP